MRYNNYDVPDNDRNNMVASVPAWPVPITCIVTVVTMYYCCYCNTHNNLKDSKHDHTMAASVPA